MSKIWPNGGKVTVHDIRMIKYTRIIENPFPDWSFFSNYIMGRLDCYFYKRLQRLGLINPHKAWSIGYEKAYSEVMERCVDE